MLAWTTEILQTEVFVNDLLNRATRFGKNKKICLTDLKRCYIISSMCGFEGACHLARWLSWLERRPVTAEVVGSSPIWVVEANAS